MVNTFRPAFEPACSIYDALTTEQRHRHDRLTEEWIEAERKAVHRAAIKSARALGLREPTIEDVMVAETLACGHVDYASKFALAVADAMRRVTETRER